jgi:predicted phosphodiesterase
MSHLKFLVCSDFHDEFYSSAVEPMDEELYRDAIVLLPGDISRAQSAVSSAVQRFPAAKLIVMVAGNHEHYKTGLTIDEANQLMLDESVTFTRAGHQVVMLENEVATLAIDDQKIRFIGTTLWTDYGLFGNAPLHALQCAGRINDHRMIRGDNIEIPDGRFTTDEAIRRHGVAKNFLIDALAREFMDGPTIVLTHHLPSLMSVSQRYKKDVITAGFASNLDDVVNMPNTLWVHGHTHDSCGWRADGGSLVVCNPAGYPRGRERENPRFDPSLMIDVRRGGPGKSWVAGIATKPPQREPNAAGPPGFGV